MNDNNLFQFELMELDLNVVLWVWCFGFGLIIGVVDDDFFGIGIYLQVGV